MTSPGPQRVEFLAAAYEDLAKLDDIDPTDHPDPLGRIHFLAILAATANDQIAEIIDQIPADQRDWDQIAAATGTTKPGAWHQRRTHRKDPAIYIV
jgi:hypothetical protein